MADDEIKCDRRPVVDKPPEKPTLERVREWAHGEGGRGPECERAKVPIYTPPNDYPGTCEKWNCDNDQWYGRGFVTRDKEHPDNIVDREWDRNKS